MTRQEHASFEEVKAVTDQELQVAGEEFLEGFARAFFAAGEAAAYRAMVAMTVTSAHALKFSPEQLHELIDLEMGIFAEQLQKREMLEALQSPTIQVQ